MISAEYLMVLMALSYFLYLSGYYFFTWGFGETSPLSIYSHGCFHLYLSSSDFSPLRDQNRILITIGFFSLFSADVRRLTGIIRFENPSFSLSGFVDLDSST
jgi:hypothetical protein